MNDKQRDEIDPTEIDGYVEFEFDLPAALLVRLIDVFSEVTATPLSLQSTRDIPDEQGVYQLFLDGELVYVGKTDGDAGLRSRLGRHSIKMLHRKGLDPARVSYKAVRVFVFTAMDLEGDLIRHYGGVGELAWNGSGFGSNDPGRKRDTTEVKSENFDAQYPIDFDLPLPVEIEEGEAAGDVVAKLKRVLPYTLRYQTAGGRSRKPHKDLANTNLPALAGKPSARALLRHVVAGLPSGWHATALPGYIIMYKNDKRNFPSGSRIATST